MKYGLTSDQLKFLLEKVVEPLDRDGARVWLYGSRARGDHQRFSDVDLMIATSTDLSRKLAAIQEELTESSFPFKVDLVQEHDFATAYRESYLKDRVELKS